MEKKDWMMLVLGTIFFTYFVYFFGELYEINQTLKAQYPSLMYSDWTYSAVLILSTWIILNVCEALNHVVITKWL